MPGDEGTWRRLKVLNFPFKFIFGKPKMDNEKEADPTLLNRIPKLAPYFVSLLLEHYKRLTNSDKKGIIEVPKYVNQQTTRYRFNTDSFFKHLKQNVFNYLLDMKSQKKKIYKNLMYFLYIMYL